MSDPQASIVIPLEGNDRILTGAWDMAQRRIPGGERGLKGGEKNRRKIKKQNRNGKRVVRLCGKGTLGLTVLAPTRHTELPNHRHVSASTKSKVYRTLRKLSFR